MKKYRDWRKGYIAPSHVTAEVFLAVGKMTGRRTRQTRFLENLVAKRRKTKKEFRHV